MKSLMFDLTTILLPKRLILLYCLIAKVMHYQNLFTGSHFPNRALAAHLGGKVNQLKFF